MTKQLTLVFDLQEFLGGSVRIKSIHMKLRYNNQRPSKHHHEI